MSIPAYPVLASDSLKNGLEETVSASENADHLHPYSPFAINTGSVKKEPTKLLLVEGIFKNHHLQPSDQLIPKLKKDHSPDWLMGVLLGIVFLFALINVFYNKKFKQIVAAFFVNRYANQAVKEENIFLQRLSLILFFTFILIIAVFLFQISIYHNIRFKDFNDQAFFFSIIGIITIVYIGKLLLVKTLGFIFKTEREISEYVFNTLLFNNILGLGLFPLVLCLAFLPQINPNFFIYTGVFFATIALFYRVIRGYIIGIGSAGISKFYLFLYLCTLEFLPLIIFIKVIKVKIL